MVVQLFVPRIRLIIPLIQGYDPIAPFANGPKYADPGSRDDRRADSCFLHHVGRINRLAENIRLALQP